MLRRLLVLTPLLALAIAAPAQAAHSFVLTRTGEKPALAVDRGGTGHFVWDQRDANGASVTHYCRVLRSGRGCLAGSERTFQPTQTTDPTNNVDFQGPRVFLAPDGRVIVLTYRCCAIDGPNFHSSVLFRYVSGDGGNTFDGGAIIGITEMDDAAFGPGDAVTTIGTGPGYTSAQAAPLAAYNEAEAQLAPGVTAVDKAVTVVGNQTVAVIGNGKTFHVGVANADPSVTTNWAFGPAGHGTDLALAGGPKGVFLLVGSNRRYTLRKVDTSKARLGRTLALTPRDFPIFGTASADPSGRVEAAWVQGRALRYRRTSKSATRLEGTHVLTHGASYFDLSVGAGASGRGWVAWDANGPNKTVRAIVTP
jgi:hypothetical protein